MVAVVLLIAMAAVPDAQAMPFPAVQTPHPAGCHSHGPATPSPAPASYQCCVTGHRCGNSERSAFSLRPAGRAIRCMGWRRDLSHWPQLSPLISSSNVVYCQQPARALLRCESRETSNSQPRRTRRCTKALRAKVPSVRPRVFQRPAISDSADAKRVVEYPNEVLVKIGWFGRSISSSCCGRSRRVPSRAMPLASIRHQRRKTHRWRACRCRHADGAARTGFNCPRPTKGPGQRGNRRLCKGRRGCG